MSLVNVTSVDVRRNPSSLTDPFELEVVFECLEDLQDDLEWKLIYVGSADNKSLDQELDCVIMGPIHRGALKFTFEADAPDFSKIPEDDIHGFTILLLTGSYRDEEFIRIGWYVHNIYVDPEVQDDPPDTPQLDKMQRHILTEAPRVTRFKISWDTKSSPFATTNSEIEYPGPSSQSNLGSAPMSSDPHSAPSAAFDSNANHRPPAVADQCFPGNAAPSYSHLQPNQGIFGHQALPDGRLTTPSAVFGNSQQPSNNAVINQPPFGTPSSICEPPRWGHPGVVPGGFPTENSNQHVNLGGQFVGHPNGHHQMPPQQAYGVDVEMR